LLRYVDAAELEFLPLMPADPERKIFVNRTWIRVLATLDIGNAIEYQKEFQIYETVDNGVTLGLPMALWRPESYLSVLMASRAERRNSCSPIASCLIWNAES
jgi:hypothetical protein